MIISSYAIINPVTVMVKFTNAFITNITMATIKRVRCLTIGTQGIGVHFLNKFLKLQIWYTSNVAWIIKCCSEIAEVNYDK